MPKRPLVRHVSVFVLISSFCPKKGPGGKRERGSKPVASPYFIHKMELVLTKYSAKKSKNPTDVALNNALSARNILGYRRYLEERHLFDFLEA